MPHLTFAEIALLAGLRTLWKAPEWGLRLVALAEAIRQSELVDRVEDQHDRVVITRNGKPAAILISHDDLESLEETLAIMSDQRS